MLCVLMRTGHKAEHTTTWTYIYIVAQLGCYVLSSISVQRSEDIFCTYTFLHFFIINPTIIKKGFDGIIWLDRYIFINTLCRFPSYHNHHHHGVMVSEFIIWVHMSFFSILCMLNLLDLLVHLFDMPPTRYTPQKKTQQKLHFVCHRRADDIFH